MPVGTPPIKIDYSNVKIQFIGWTEGPLGIELRFTTSAFG